MNPDARRPPWLHRVAGALGVALALYLASPALTSGHLEAVTAQTQSIAWMRAWRPTVAHDPYLPLLSQFALQTRSGVVLLLSAILRLVPAASDGAYRALVLCSLVVQCVASVSFARRAAGVGPAAALVALALTPFVFETAFFFNDNVVAGAFAAASLALAVHTATPRRAALAGLLFALGVQCRFDTVFAAPLLAASLWMEPADRRVRAWRLVAAGATALAVNLALAVYLGFSLVDVASIAPTFVFPVRDPDRWIDVRVYAIGLISLPLVVAGAAQIARERLARRELLFVSCLLAYPALLVIALPSITQMRYVFSLLVPLVAMYGGRGLVFALRQLGAPDRSRRELAWLFALWSLCVLLAPPARVRVLEGPRSFFGRVRLVAEWRAWQQIVADNRVEALRLVASLDDGRQHVLVATHYNDDIYMRQRLIEAGFLPRATEEVFPGCTGFSVMEKGRSRVLHVRTDPQYHIPHLSYAYSAALHIRAAWACPALASTPRVHVSAFGDYYPRVHPAVYGFTIQDFPAPQLRIFHDVLTDMRLFDLGIARYLYYRGWDASFGYFRQRTLDASQVARMRSGAETYLAQHHERDARSGGVATIETFLALFRPNRGPTQALLTGLRDRVARRPTRNDP